MWTVIAEWATQCFLLVNTRSTIETIKEFVNLLNKRSCCEVFTAAPSRKNIKKEIIELSYMTDYHISSGWKVTHFKGTAVKKIVSLITLFLIVKS
jgi:hypothetical protein